MLHELQAHILKTLTLVGAARYSELKPASVESNAFMYHLKKLVVLGYVYKRGATYHLSASGKRYADRTTLASFKERVQPKIVTMIVIKNTKGEHLLFTRKRQPFLGKTGFPYGKTHLEERVHEAAERELREKTGLSSSLTYRGDVYLHICDEGDLITHMLCHVFEGKDATGTLMQPDDVGEAQWKKIDEVKSDKLLPGTKHIKKLLSRSNNLFFEEYFLNTTEEY